MGQNGKPIYEDALTRLYQGEAEDVLRDIADGFDVCIFDPPRSGPYLGERGASDLRLLPPLVEEWVVAFAGNAKQQRRWKRDKAAFRLPPFYLPKWNDDERVLLVPMKELPISPVAPALPDHRFYEPPEWCPAARHPGLYRWLYLLLKPTSVLDPFAGSGNSLIEARKLGIPSVGIEKRPDRADQIRRRLLA